MQSNISPSVSLSFHLKHTVYSYSFQFMHHFLSPTHLKNSPYDEDALLIIGHPLASIPFSSWAAGASTGPPLASSLTLLTLLSSLVSCTEDVDSFHRRSASRANISFSTSKVYLRGCKPVPVLLARSAPTRDKNDENIKSSLIRCNIALDTGGGMGGILNSDEDDDEDTDVDVRRLLLWRIIGSCDALIVCIDAEIRSG